MTKARLLLSVAAITLFSNVAHATPYCPEMLDKNALETRYQRLAPIYNSVETGWMFGSDQFGNAFALNEAQQKLMAQIVTALAEQGTSLGILIAPPRPVIAGQTVVDLTVGAAGTHDVAAEAAAFETMISQLKAAGAVVPDLQALALSNDTINNSFYFARDTHWTNAGAAYAALALAAEVYPDRAAAFEVDRLQVLEAFAERGSLSDIARATCDLDPGKEATTVFDYSGLLPSAGGLLGDVEVEAVLLGTSFSDRYRRDQYQTADAISAALDLSVTNLSVSGGGMIGPFETYVLTGQLAAEQPRLLIWEFPYTYELKEPQLRQLLGALRATEPSAEPDRYDIVDGAARIPLSAGADLIGITLEGGAPLKIRAKLRHADGSVTKLRLKRKKRMAEVATLGTWWVDLSGLDLDGAQLEIQFKDGDGVLAVSITRPVETG